MVFLHNLFMRVRRARFFRSIICVCFLTTTRKSGIGFGSSYPSIGQYFFRLIINSYPRSSLILFGKDKTPHFVQLNFFCFIEENYIKLDVLCSLPLANILQIDLAYCIFRFLTWISLYPVLHPAHGRCLEFHWNLQPSLQSFLLCRVCSRYSDIQAESFCRDM